MRVLFINRMASMVRGGGETFDLEISRYLERLGGETSFLTGVPLTGRAQAPIDRPRSYAIRTPYLAWFPWDKVKGGWRLRVLDLRLFEERAASWAARRRDQFDVVQVCELPFFVAKLKRLDGSIPVVMRLTAPDFYNVKEAVRLADAVIASGATLKAVSGSIRPDCADIPNGVDTAVFRPHESRFRADRGIGAGEFVVLCVARFQGVKNHRMLLDAFANVLGSWPSSRLVLAGSGPLEQRVRRQCRDLGIADRVMFLGEVSFADLPGVYAAADVGVVPSYYESFCFSALEAMASGLPLVVTRTDWVPGLIEGERGGFVVAQDDAAAFARALLDLARDASLRREKGRFNRDKAFSYGWDQSARRLMELYGRVGGEGRT